MNQKLIWPDLLKVSSIFFVILLHTSMPYLYRFNSISLINWQIANIFDSLSRMAVPVFFMISGAIYLNRPGINLMTFYKDKFIKIVFPLFFWSIVYLFWDKYYLNSDIDLLHQVIQKLYLPKFYHLWFYML